MGTGADIDYSDYLERVYLQENKRYPEYEDCAGLYRHGRYPGRGGESIESFRAREDTG